MAPTPKTKAEDLIEQVNRLLTSREKDEFTITRLKKEATTSVKTDPFHGYIALGMISALEEKIDDVRTHYRAALKFSPNDFLANLSFFGSLTLLGYCSESLQYGEKACQQRPDDGNALHHFLDSLLRAGRLRKANQIIDKLSKLKHEIPQTKIDLAKESIFFLQEREVNDHQVEELVDLSLSVLRDKKVLFERSSFELLEDEESKFLAFLYEVDRPVEEIVELNYEAAKKLAAAPELDDTADSVIVSFTSSIPD